MDRRRRRRLVVAAALTAFVLRLAFGFFYWTGKPLTHDEREYLTLAASIRDGRGFTYPEGLAEGTSRGFSRAPGYPFFLALCGVTALTDSTPSRVKIAQSLLGALAVLLIASIARRAAGERAAVASAWLAAIYPSLVWMPSYAMSEAVYLPLALAAVHLLTLNRFMAAGLILGAATLVRSSTLVFLPLAAIWLARRHRLTAAATFTIAAALVIAPWTVRNVRHYGRLVLVASDGGVSFWTGNHPLARGEGDLAANPELKRAEVAFRAAHPGLTPEQLEPLYYRSALQHMRNDPLWWLGLVIRKSFYAVVPVGPSYTLHSTKYLLATVVPYATLAPLAIAGFIVIRRSGRPALPFYLLAASVLLTTLIFFPQERFRLPVIDPLIIVGAGAAVAAATRDDS